MHAGWEELLARLFRLARSEYSDDDHQQQQYERASHGESATRADLVDPTTKRARETTTATAAPADGHNILSDRARRAI